MFKGGSIRIEKCTLPNGDTNRAKEQQTATVQARQDNRISADSIADTAPRERHLDV